MVHDENKRSKHGAGKTQPAWSFHRKLIYWNSAIVLRSQSAFPDLREDDVRAQNDGVASKSRRSDQAPAFGALKTHLRVAECLPIADARQILEPVSKERLQAQATL